MRVCAENGMKCAPSSWMLRPRSPCFSLTSTTIERPSGVSSARLASCAASASSSSRTPSAGMSAVAMRLPSVMVPVLSRSSTSTSPAASTARPLMAMTFLRKQAVHAGDADGRQQAADRRRDQADQQRHDRRRRQRDRRVERERHQGHAGEQKDDGEPDEQDVQRDLVRRLLSRGALDERDHAIEERLAGIGGDAHDDAIGQHLGAAGDRRAIAARLADDRRRLAGDRRLVDGGDALDHLAVAGDELAGLDDDAVTLAQLRRRHRLLAPVDEAARHRLLPHLAQRRRLRLAAPLGDRLGEVGEQDGEPQPHGDRRREPDRRVSGGVMRDVAHEQGRRQQASDADHEHDRVLRQEARVQLRKLSTIAGRKIDGSNSEICLGVAISTPFRNARRSAR